MSGGRFDAAVNAALPGVCAVLAVVVALRGVLDLVAEAGPTRWVMVSLSLAAALLFGGLAFLARTRQLPIRLAHPTMTLVWLVCAAVSSTHLWLAHDPRFTTNTMLVLVGAGSFVLDLRWWAGLLAATLGLWSLAMLAVMPDETLRWVFAVLGAGLIGLVVGAMRRSAIDRYAEVLERAERASVEDPLTGLLNRRGLSIVGQQVVAAARRSGNAVHCVFVDVDGLKDVNDRRGHVAGDRVLLAVADAIRLSVRSGDVVARWGGDEFCVLGPGPGTAPVELERRIVLRVLEVPMDDVPGWVPGVSAGSAMLAPWDEGDLSSLLDQADREMYRRRALRRDNDSVPTRPLGD